MYIKVVLEGAGETNPNTFSIVYFAQNFIPHKTRPGKKKAVYISITKLHKLLIRVFKYVIDTQIPPEHV